MDRRRFGLMAGAALAGSRWALAAPAVKTVRLSFMLWALERQASFDQSVEMVAAAGYQGIELTGQFQSWTAAERDRVMTKMKTHGMVFDSMSGVKTGFAVAEETEMFFAQFAEHLRFAKELQCPQVILLSGKRVGEAGAQFGVAVENLKRAAEMAAKEQIEIVIEPIDLLENPTIYLATVSDGFEIARAVKAGNVKVLYDFYHEQRSFGNLMEKLEKNIELVGLVHVADVPGRHEPGTGEIDYEAIYRKLAELGYERWVAMEFYPTGAPVACLKQARLAVEQGFRLH